MQIKKTIPGFFNGVSQQPASTRLDTQCELEENMLGTLVDGLISRPNSEFIANLTSNTTSNSFIHSINRDQSEQYIMIVTGNETTPIEIIKLDGTACTVNYTGDAADYFVSSNPHNDFKATTIADYTIISNKTKQCTMTTPGTFTPFYEALIFVEKGVQETDYKVIKYDGTVLATDTTGATTDPTSFKTSTIANDLKTALVTSLGAGWTVEVKGSIIHLKTTNAGIASDYLRVEDSWGNQAMSLIPGYTQSFSDLPVCPFANIKVKITGDVENQFSSYYVQSTTEGTWKEIAGDNQAVSVDASTMPHKAVRTSENTFTVSSITWLEKTIGDANSAPNPSFIGDYINDTFFFQNRLGFLSGENVILSRAGDFFNFFPTTALDVLDDDPIDVAASTTQVNILNSASPFNENLLIDSNQQQFLLTAGTNLLTPKTVQIKPITRYITSSTCKPTAAGTNLYFVVPVDKYSGIKEYYVASDSYMTDATDITAHADKYLPANITTLISNTTTNMIFAFSTDQLNTLYHYSYLWQGNEKIQSAWNKWTFDDNILGIAVIDTNLFLITKKGTTDACLVKINLANVKTGALPFRVHLDKLKSIQGTYSSVTNKTTWTIPYNDISNKFTFVDAVNGMQLVTVTQVNGTTFESPGQYTEHQYLIGKKYTGKYRFSEWFIKDQNGIADLEGRLQIKKLMLQFVNTGPFRVEVTPHRRDTVTHEYSGVILGYSYFDTPTIVSQTKSFLVMCNARNSVIELVCDTYLPVQFILAEFVGDYTSSVRKI
jgi:hypothetical protein